MARTWYKILFSDETQTKHHILWNQKTLRCRKKCLLWKCLAKSFKSKDTVHNDDFASAATLSELDFKPLSNYWNNFAKPEISRNPFDLYLTESFYCFVHNACGFHLAISSSCFFYIACGLNFVESSFCCF